MKQKRIWVCMACGKVSEDKYGEKPITKGWDVSCVLNSVQCYSNKLVYNSDGRVCKLQDGAIVRHKQKKKVSDANISD